MIVDGGDDGGGGNVTGEVELQDAERPVGDGRASSYNSVGNMSISTGVDGDGANTSLTGAHTEFAIVAGGQQRQQQHSSFFGQRFGFNKGTGSGRASHGIDDGVRFGYGGIRSRSIRTMLFIMFFVLVFGCIFALYLYCIYLGAFYVNEPCDARLGVWLIVHGLLGVVGITLVVVVSVPPSVNDSGEDGMDIPRLGSSSRAGFLQGRIAPPSFSREGVAQGRHSRALVAAVGFFQLCILVWFCVGTAWVAEAGDLKNKCPDKLVSFCLTYVCVVWALVLVVFIGSCIVAGARHCKQIAKGKNMENLGGDSFEEDASGEQLFM